MKNIKKYIKISYTILIIFAIVIIISGSASAATKINKKSIYLVKGQTYTLKVKDASEKVKWKSKNKNIATVSSSGKVKALKKGNAEIIAKIGGQIYKCKVRVANSYSNKKLCDMVVKYYNAIGKSIPKDLIIEVDSRSGNMANVHVYTIVEEDPDFAHTSTWDWFFINVKTGKAENVPGEKFNLKKYAN